MALHLFATPIQCTNCGTVVDDPTADKCPKCNALLKERRTPSRIAGVERRYGNLRILLSVLRFLGITTALLGVLVFLFSEESIPLLGKVLSLLGAVLLATGMFVIASLLDVILDLEENTRATFRLQQLMFEDQQPPRRAE